MYGGKLLLIICVLTILSAAASVAGRYHGEQLFYKSLPHGKSEFPGQISRIADTVRPSIHDEILPDMVVSSLFDSDHKWIATLSAEKIRTILATGDVIPARSVNAGSVKRNSFTWPFEKTAEILRSADLTLINLESPLLKSCTPTVTGMSFCGDSKHIEGIIHAGIDIAGIANNHSENYGASGVAETVELLNVAGISVTGIDTQPVIHEIRGLRFAFLSYNDIGPAGGIVAWADTGTIQNDIQKAKKKSDVIIVSFHWGAEYQSLPDQRQQYLGRFAIESGADLVIGNHPHWIQPPELFKGKFIMYAHGNFIFDQEWSEETKLGVIGKYTFYDKKLIDVEFIPIRIEDYGQPYILEGAAKKSVLDKLKHSALELNRK